MLSKNVETTRSDMRNEWAPDEQPWARRAGDDQPDRGLEGPGYLVCPFCGARSAKRSYGDEAADNGRLKLYCTNEHCQAREIVVLVLKDTYRAHTAPTYACSKRSMPRRPLSRWMTSHPSGRRCVKSWTIATGP